jgi:hypothetical protein
MVVRRCTFVQDAGVVISRLVNHTPLYSYPPPLEREPDIDLSDALAILTNMHPTLPRSESHALYVVMKHAVVTMGKTQFDTK